MIATRANNDRNCTRCGAVIPKGSVYFMYRERALSHHEASHAGTLYPKRKCCVACKERQDASRIAVSND